MNLLNQIKARLFSTPPAAQRMEFKVTSSCVFTEYVKPQDFVFSGGCSLAVLEASGVEFRLVFEPVMKGSPVARLLLLRNGNINSDVFYFSELTGHANYRQVTELVEYKRQLRRLRDAAKTSGGFWVPTWAFALFGLASLLYVVFSIGNKQLATEKLVTSQGTPPIISTPAKVLLSEGDQLNSTEKAALAQVVRQSGIELSQGGKPFVVFSDPNCPACRELEAKLATLDKSLAPIIVPVSFKDGSPAAVSGILCAKDVLAAWRTAAAGGAPAESCDKGSAQAVTNNAAFVALRFDKTPTFVTANGKVAVGAKDFEGLTRWLKENSVD